MAGSYPDAPGHRMVYDRDGTSVLNIDANGLVVLNDYDVSTKQLLNRGANNLSSVLQAGNSQSRWLCFLFPELRDIVGYIHGISVGSNGSVGATEWSPDTTNGIDGTWNSLGVIGSDGLDAVSMRTGISALSITGAKAIRWRGTSSSGGVVREVRTYYVHIYGGPSAGQNPDRLRLWHPTLDQEIGGAYFDWGDVPRSTSADRTFRVKNNSATLQANGILLSLSTLTDASPSVPGQHLLSQDGSNFAATQNIGVLAPGAISPVLTLRRVTPSNAAFSLWAARVDAVATTWT